MIPDKQKSLTVSILIGLIGLVGSFLSIFTHVNSFFLLIYFCFLFGVDTWIWSTFWIKKHFQINQKSEAENIENTWRSSKSEKSS